jgi:pimeloyl-ACP methyl ester carboxylesterase
VPILAIMFSPSEGITMKAFVRSQLVITLVAAGLVTACTTLPAITAAPSRVAFSKNVEFSGAAVKNGVTADSADCQLVQAVWVESKTHGSECLRYWKAGFESGQAKRAIVFFHGDVWTGREADPNYLRLTEETLQTMADAWAKRLGMPYIYFARPGTHGSSGDHMQRRRKGESEQISIALDQLKQQYNISEYVLVGQSGGGHVTASLLVKRNDIVCAVPTSSVSSPRSRWILRGWNNDSTGAPDSYEPTEFLVKANKHPNLRIVVVGNVEDRNTPWASQTLLSGRAKALGIPVMELTGEGTGSEKHSMSISGRIVAGWCAQDLSDEQIRENAKAGLKG